jgi:hypothetical protein
MHRHLIAQHPTQVTAQLAAKKKKWLHIHLHIFLHNWLHNSPEQVTARSIS